MNLHFKNRYDKFISSIQSKGFRNLEYFENHHIIPKCLGGCNEQSNMIKLSLREHYIAHLLLAKAYMTYNLISAFVQMDVKNAKILYKEKFIPKSRIFEKFRKKMHPLLGKQNINKIRVRDEEGNVLVLTKDEYSNSHYKFHTMGMVGAMNIETGKSEWVTKDEYSSREELKFHGWCGPKSTIKIRDKLTNSIIEVSYNDYVENYKHVKELIDEKIRPTNRYVIVKEGNIRGGKKTGYVPVFDKIERIRKTVSKEEYYSDSDRYLTVSKGNVPVFDTVEEKYLLIPKCDFDGKRFVGVTKGFTSVFDKNENRTKTVSIEEFNSNRDRYSGPCTGKINVVFKETGTRGQILKSEFNSEIHYPASGALFKCRNILTNLEKYINIYEWKFVKDSYEVIDQKKFNNLKLKHNQ